MQAIRTNKSLYKVDSPSIPSVTPSRDDVDGDLSKWLLLVADILSLTYLQNYVRDQLTSLVYSRRYFRAWKDFLGSYAH